MPSSRWVGINAKRGGRGGGGWVGFGKFFKTLESSLKFNNRVGNFISYVKIEYKETEVFWVAVTSSKQQIFETNALF